MNENERQRELLSIADACYAVYSLEELGDPALLHEVKECYPFYSSTEIEYSVHLASLWKAADEDDTTIWN